MAESYEFDPLTGDPLPKTNKREAGSNIQVTASHSPLSADVLARLEGMSRGELIALVRRLYRPENVILTVEAIRDIKSLVLTGKKIDLTKYW